MSPLDDFALYYEALPSDEKVDKLIRQSKKSQQSP
jgi:hypothetical protein